MDAPRSAPSEAPPHPSAGQEAAVAAVVPTAEALQASLVDFALAELVRQHRTSFPPPWSVESWAKLLIWLALNSGCPAESLALFAAALGPERSSRLRRLFFSRELQEPGLRLLADPAEGQVLLQPTESAGWGAGNAEAELERVAAALQQVGLSDLVLSEPQLWQRRDGLVVVPFRSGSHRCS
jgi:hypothetical protein